MSFQISNLILGPRVYFVNDASAPIMKKVAPIGSLPIFSRGHLVITLHSKRKINSFYSLYTDESGDTNLMLLPYVTSQACL